MTAEICVMNKLGVALAADSAVSLGPSAQKIYTSAEKLFQLSESAPIGIMTYGNAEFVDVPWETIIKMFRTHLGNQTYFTLAEYVDSFSSYLTNHPTLFPEEVQVNNTEFLAYEICANLLRDFNSEIDNKLKQVEDLGEEDIRQMLHSFIDETAEEIKSLESIEGFDDEYREVLHDKIFANIDRVQKSVFEDLPRDEHHDKKLTLLVLHFLCVKRNSDFTSGIVLAGFGEQEHYPSIVELKILGMVANRLMCWRDRERKIEFDCTASVSPFAQQEMVVTFMEGIDPELQDIIEGSTENLFEGVVDVILAKVESKYPAFVKKNQDVIKSEVSVALKDMFDNWTNVKRKYFVDPVVEIVSALPKDELAAMAEALVNLTKVKRRVSRQKETVGGPIDVAIITKGDGFVWSKRKHYFSPELNPRYFKRISKD